MDKNNKLQNFIYEDLKADIHDIKKHIRTLNDEQGQMKDEMASFRVETVKEIGSVKTCIAKIKGKTGAFAIIVPILTGTLGALAVYALTR